jgi:hypothetical protein
MAAIVVVGFYRGSWAATAASMIAEREESESVDN